MRLINTSTGVVETFLGRNIPQYAILSHTWEYEEVSFADITQPSRNKSLKGFAKIEGTCKLALTEGFQYAWVDTCCIDKTSSSKLSEAINYMYRWYQRSATCYVYLSDLNSDDLETALPKCRWFTRAWTLQELIAPQALHFYDASWNYRGSKSNLGQLLSTITGIDSAVLRHETALSSLSVAQRMAWAARRETTLVEDRAYSLLGILRLNMPLLYGEEGGTFRKLQEEIIKSILDSSIFAWRLPAHTRPPEHGKGRFVSGIMAESPDLFADCLSFCRQPTHSVPEFSVSSRGIKTNSIIHRYDHSADAGQLESNWLRYGLILPLDCCLASGPALGIFLKKMRAI